MPLAFGMFGELGDLHRVGSAAQVRMGQVEPVAEGQPGRALGVRPSGSGEQPIASTWLGGNENPAASEAQVRGEREKAIMLEVPRKRDRAMVNWCRRKARAYSESDLVRVVSNPVRRQGLEEGRARQLPKRKFVSCWWWATRCVTWNSFVDILCHVYWRCGDGVSTSSAAT